MLHDCYTEPDTIINKNIIKTQPSSLKSLFKTMCAKSQYILAKWTQIPSKAVNRCVASSPLEELNIYKDTVLKITLMKVPQEDGGCSKGGNDDKLGINSLAIS